MGLLDGIPSLEVRSATFSGNNALFTNVSGTDFIATAEIDLGAVSGGVVGSGGIGRTHIALATVSGGHVISGGISLAHHALASVSGGHIVSGTVAISHMAANAASGGIVSSEYSTALVGSPSIFGMLIQGGSQAMVAATGTWVVFGRAFVGPPYVVTLSGRGSAVGQYHAPVGSITAGSFFAVASTNQPFSWLAVGSGR